MTQTDVNEPTDEWGHLRELTPTIHRSAAEAVCQGAAARVVFGPGDGTRYDIVITRTVHKPEPYLVSIASFGTCYWWGGEHPSVHRSYAAEKWTRPRNEASGWVIAEFLNEIARLRCPSPRVE